MPYLCGHWAGEIHENIRNQINMYSKEFGRVLRGEVVLSTNEDVLKLKNDLYGLRKWGCPEQALVEMMLACTSESGVTIPDLLWRAERLSECLRSHHNLGFPTEPCPTIQGRPGEKPLRGFPRLRRVRRGIPLSIQFMLADLGERPDFRKRRHLAYFYLLVKHFGWGHENLAHVLRIMQHVRRRVPPVADYLQTSNTDSFTEMTVEKRVLRLFKSESEDNIRQEILQYLSKQSEQQPFNTDEREVILRPRNHTELF